MVCIYVNDMSYDVIATLLFYGYLVQVFFKQHEVNLLIYDTILLVSLDR